MIRRLNNDNEDNYGGDDDHDDYDDKECVKIDDSPFL